MMQWYFAFSLNGYVINEVFFCAGFKVFSPGLRLKSGKFQSRRAEKQLLSKPRVIMNRDLDFDKVLVNSASPKLNEQNEAPSTSLVRPIPKSPSVSEAPPNLQESKPTSGLPSATDRTPSHPSKALVKVSNQFFLVPKDYKLQGKPQNVDECQPVSSSKGAHFEDTAPKQTRISVAKNTKFWKIAPNESVEPKPLKFVMKKGKLNFLLLKYLLRSENIKTTIFQQLDLEVVKSSTK